MTVCEKVLARASKKERVAPGEIIDAFPDVAMSHDNAFLVHQVFKETGATAIANPSAVAIVLDHRVPANSVSSANTQRAVRKISSELGIERFFDVGVGICHQVLIEKGLAKPGMLIVGTDSHSTSYGAVGAIGIGVGATDMASVWAKGSLWLKVPESIRLNINGNAGRGVYAKDVALAMVSRIGSMGADYCSIEFHGSYLEKSNLSERITLCNMAAETGAKCAVVPRETMPDRDAKYLKSITIDVGGLEPMVSMPHSVDNVVPVTDIEGTRIDQAFLGSCTNGRLDDLQIAAQLLERRKVNRDVRLIVTPASTEIYLKAMRLGIIDKLMRAGAVVTNPGCGPCLGAHQGVLGEREVCISSSNRNFRGRMGSADAKIFLASPATVVASAIEGRITDPRRFLT
ncbi:MAG: 3-isopropylmalate dehydratase large subunit [Thermoplasmata archaeon]